MTLDQPRLPPVVQLNELSPSDFAAAIQPLFESAGPLTGALHAARPFTSYDELIERAESIAAQLPYDQQVEVLNAHPRIGEKASVVRARSSLAYREQGYDREADLPAEVVQRVYSELDELNRAYEERFGFPFVVFVNKRPKSEVAAVLRDRLRNSRAAELETGLHELFAIARDRRRQLLM